MNNNKQFKIKNNKIIIAFIASIILIIIVIISLFLIFSKKDLTNKLKDIGTNFYENYYYDRISSNDEERKKFLNIYRNNGLKISLLNLIKYNLDYDISLFEKNNCDLEKTKIIIYPKEDYSKNDYRLEVVLECD